MKFQIFSENISWPVLMNIQMSELMVITSQFSTHFNYKNDKNIIFQLWECKPCLISTQKMWEIMYILIYCWYKDICCYPYLEKNENFPNFMYNIYDKLWGDDITRLAHLNIHKDWSRNVFRKNLKFQYVTTSLFLIRFSSFLHQSVGKFFLFLLKLW